jgi:Protein of unknown function (DUF2842)
MTLRQRKLAGTFASVAFIAVYCLVAMALGGAYVVGRGGVTEFVFFAIAGFAWLPVVMVLIRWMSRGAAE